MSKTNTKILVGICGGIAAYKACEVVRLLCKQGHSVQVMMSVAAQKFVTPLTLQALTGKAVATDLFSTSEEHEIGHIKLADAADLVLIVPATADVMAKAAHGICDDLVTTVLLATQAPIVFAASMNVNMYHHPATQNNIDVLAKRGCHIIDPEEGELACGWQGKGRLAEPVEIVQEVEKILKK